MWQVRTTDTFDRWFNTLDDVDRTNVIAVLIVLRERGPLLSRPYADTVKGSVHKNMKELRVQSKGKPLRAFFAFDPYRDAIVLCGGEKTGRDKLFYHQLIAIADREFSRHLESLKRSK